MLYCGRAEASFYVKTLGPLKARERALLALFEGKRVGKKAQPTFVVPSLGLKIHAIPQLGVQNRTEGLAIVLSGGPKEVVVVSDERNPCQSKPVLVACRGALKEQ